MRDIYWSVDTLVIRDSAVFGFGWVFHIAQEVVEIHLRLTIDGDDSLSPVYLTADIGKLRQDVELNFSTQPHTRNSGYVFYGAFPVGRRVRSIELLCTLKDGSILDFEVPEANIMRFSDDKKGTSNRRFLRQFYVFVKRGLTLLRAGKYNSLSSKVRRYIGGRPSRVLRDPADFSEFLAEHERKNLTVIVDHDLGGGANHYRERMVASIIQQGRSVVILTFHVVTLSHVLVLRNSRVNHRFAIPSKEFFLVAVRDLSVSEIIYNTGVSFLQPEELAPLLISLKQITSAQLNILLHDYFVVCPSHNLINHEGNYCEVPNIDVCSGCILKNKQGFATLFVGQDMHKWRAIWGSLLNACDEIVTFSNNSTEILTKAYPELDPFKISVIPHNILHLKGSSPQIKNTSCLRIGIVGQIGFHKGSRFVKALGEEIKRRKISVKIVIIGTIEADCDSTIVTETGAYEYSNLSGLIQDSGANVMLFPSIWPETFSYVVHELIAFNLPVASFNFGAPSARLASYSNGLVLNSTNPEEVLDELISFHRALYLPLRHLC
jgi:glycosyltransferase involved in cell wall biosynthesis